MGLCMCNECPARLRWGANWHVQAARLRAHVRSPERRLPCPDPLGGPEARARKRAPPTVSGIR
eukprot:1361148-Alexandrium_andersonii.AAC.1